MKEKLYYQCLLCGRSTEINKNMETIEIDGIRMFLCPFCKNGGFKWYFKKLKQEKIILI